MSDIPSIYRPGDCDCTFCMAKQNHNLWREVRQWLWFIFLVGIIAAALVRF